MHARLQTRQIRYWRTKHGNESDFVLSSPNHPPTAIECKRSADEFTMRNLKAFRARYPDGLNYVVAMDVDRPFEHDHKGITVRFVSLHTFADELTQGGFIAT
jgi:hypothetical protein